MIPYLLAMDYEETTKGRHRHQDWTVEKRPHDHFPDEMHLEVSTCNVCGTQFIIKRLGPLPKQEG